MNRVLFYTDTGNNVIASMSLYGSNFRQIVTTDLDKPREVVLDPRNRYVCVGENLSVFKNLFFSLIALIALICDWCVSE